MASRIQCIVLMIWGLVLTSSLIIILIINLGWGMKGAAYCSIGGQFLSLFAIVVFY